MVENQNLLQTSVQMLVESQNLIQIRNFGQEYLRIFCKSKFWYTIYLSIKIIIVTEMETTYIRPFGYAGHKTPRIRFGFVQLRNIDSGFCILVESPSGIKYVVLLKIGNWPTTIRLFFTCYAWLRYFLILRFGIYFSATIN